MSKREYRTSWDSLFRTEFEKESDRASVILATAMLEQSLETAIRGKLVPCASGTDPLFDDAYAPASTFSAKIELAFRIGLVAAHTARELHLIRKIRNEFAHNVTGCSFENAAVQSRVSEISNSLRWGLVSDDIRKLFLPGPRGDFQAAVSWIMWLLSSLASTVSSLEPPQYKWRIGERIPKDKKDTDDSQGKTDKP